MDASAGNFSIVVGASKTTDATGAWSVYSWPSGAVWEDCLDQPRIGYSSNLIVVTANVYQRCTFYAGTQMWALNKQQLVSGQHVDFMTWAPVGELWSMEPVQSLTASDVQYGVSMYGPDFSLVTVTGIPPAATAYTLVDLPIASLTRPLEAVQAGAPDAVDTGTVRTLDAMWSNGMIWATSADSCLPPGDTVRRACARVVAASTSPVAIVDDRDLSLGPGSYVYYPAVRADAGGNAVVVFGYSSATDFPSVGVATKTATTDWDGWISIAAGTSAQLSGRWGDYFAAASDPTAPGRVWVSGQVSQPVDGTRAGNGWGTVVGSVVRNAQPAAVSYPMPSATAITTTAATITAAVNAESDDTAWHFEWGRTTAYGTSTATVELPAGAVPQAVRVRLTGLAPATRYHFRIAAANSAGPSLGVDQTFTTKPKPKPKKKKPANR
jgi:hypothetical protein